MDNYSQQHEDNGNELNQSIYSSIRSDGYPSIDPFNSKLVLLLTGRMRCGLSWSWGGFSMEVQMNMESNFEMSRVVHKRGEIQQLNGRVRAKRLISVLVGFVIRAEQ